MRIAPGPALHHRSRLLVTCDSLEMAHAAVDLAERRKRQLLEAAARENARLAATLRMMLARRRPPATADAEPGGPSG